MDAAEVSALAHRRVGPAGGLSRRSAAQKFLRRAACCAKHARAVLRPNAGVGRLEALCRAPHPSGFRREAAIWRLIIGM